MCVCMHDSVRVCVCVAPGIALAPHSTSDGLVHITAGTLHKSVIALAYIVPGIALAYIAPGIALTYTVPGTLRKSVIALAHTAPGITLGHRRDVSWRNSGVLWVTAAV